MRLIKASVKHKIGNIISGVIALADAIIQIISLGNISPGLVLEWSMYRRRTGVLCDCKRTF